jgi:DNA-directed RNA polymerase subunit H (RpoH/RPB5)
MSLKPAQILDYIYKSRETIIIMLKERGFDIESYSSYSKDDLNTLFEQGNSKIYNSGEIGPLDILVKRTNDEKKEETLFVKYRMDKFKKTKSLEQQILDIYNSILKKEDTLIIIHLDNIEFKPTKKESNVELFIDDLYAKYEYFVQLYGIKNLLFDVRKHYTVPEHKLITKKEQKELFIKYNIKSNSNFPTIRKEDPQAKFIGLRPYEICHIIQPSLTNIHSDYYRMCVN